MNTLILVLISFPLISWGIVSKYLGIPVALTGASTMIYTLILLIYRNREQVAEINIISIFIISVLGIVHAGAFYFYTKIIENPHSFGFKDYGTFISGASATMFVLSMALGVVILKDEISLNKIMGILIVCLGIYITQK